MQNTPLNHARTYVSVLFLSSIVSIVFGGILGLLNNVEIMLFLIIFGMMMLIVSISSAFYILNKQRTIPAESMNTSNQDKAQAVSGIGEILLYMFVSK